MSQCKNPNCYSGAVYGTDGEFKGPCLCTRVRDTKPAAARETVRRWGLRAATRAGQIIEHEKGDFVLASDYDALAARVEELGRELEHRSLQLANAQKWSAEAVDDRDKFRAQRDALQRECESLRANDMRYRWLRDRWFIAGAAFPDELHEGAPSAAHFDDAIDSAMSAAGGEVKP